MRALASSWVAPSVTKSSAAFSSACFFCSPICASSFAFISRASFITSAALEITFSCSSLRSSSKAISSLPRISAASAVHALINASTLSSWVANTAALASGP